MMLAIGTVVTCGERVSRGTHVGEWQALVMPHGLSVIHLKKPIQLSSYETYTVHFSVSVLYVNKKVFKIILREEEKKGMGCY